MREDEDASRSLDRKPERKNVAIKLAWLTDPHLNFAGIPKTEALINEIGATSPDALLLTGDIGESDDLEGWLQLMNARLDCPTYFVLGNHDFYGSTIEDVRALASELTEAFDRVFWLGCQDVISLSPETALIGHDGWGDGREGNMMTSRVMLADFMRIADLRGLDRKQLQAKLATLGDEAAEFLRPRLSRALATHRHTIVLMHVPPFRESAWHEGNASDDEWSPYFVCQAVGDLLLEVAADHPGAMLTVLCGHTHSGGEVWMAPNLRVRTGGAVYRKPALQDPLVMP
jgi:3',5'-cyclic AMP phosphodiesterase CpdA